MSLCNNQKQKEEKVRINKLLKTANVFCSQLCRGMGMCVLVQSGVEWIFLIGTGMGWCCGDSVDNSGMFSLLLSRVYSGLFCSSPHLTPPNQWVGWGHRRLLEGTQLGQLILTDPMDFPGHMAWWSACRAGRRRKQLGHLGWWHLSSQVTVMCYGVLLSCGWRTSAYPWGMLKEFLISLCLCQQLLFSPLNCSHLNPHKFSHTYPSDFLPHLAVKGVSEQLGSASCWLGLNHNTILSWLAMV